MTTGTGQSLPGSAQAAPPTHAGPNATPGHQRPPPPIHPRPVADSQTNPDGLALIDVANGKQKNLIVPDCRAAVAEAIRRCGRPAGLTQTERPTGRHRQMLIRRGRVWARAVKSGSRQVAQHGSRPALPSAPERSFTEPPRRPGNSRQPRLGIRQDRLLTHPPAAIYGWGRTQVASSPPEAEARQLQWQRTPRGGSERGQAMSRAARVAGISGMWCPGGPVSRSAKRARTLRKSLDASALC